MKRVFPIAVPLACLALCLMRPAAAGPPLSDVPPGHWAAGSVARVVSQKLMETEKDGKFRGDKPVTRYELAVTLDRFVRFIEAGRKPLHPSAPRPGVSVPKRTPSDVRQAVNDLVTNGFLPATSPLFLGSGSTPVTAQQLADAMAQVTIRLSDRSLPVTSH